MDKLFFFFFWDSKEKPGLFSLFESYIYEFWRNTVYTKLQPDIYLYFLPVTFHQGFGDFVQVSVNVFYTKMLSVP